MEVINLLGIVGTILIALAYIPQIIHIISKHCAYGISIKAWFIWFIATLLILPRAAASAEKLFVTLLIIHAVAIAFILIFSYFHKDRICPKHKIL